MSRLLESVTAIKASATLAGATLLSGISTVVGFIPDDIGKFASLTGGMLSIVIGVYWRRCTDLKNIELQIAKLELERHQREAEQRRRAGDV